MKSVTVKQAVARLNEALAAKPTEVSALFQQRVSCADSFLPGCPLRTKFRPGASVGEDQYEFGLLGILNAIFGDGVEPGPIIALVREQSRVNEQRRIVRFEAYTEPETIERVEA